MLSFLGVTLTIGLCGVRLVVGQFWYGAEANEGGNVCRAGDDFGQADGRGGGSGGNGLPGVEVSGNGDKTKRTGLGRI